MTTTIGTMSRDGLLLVTDTAWDSNGTMRVTVRELIGGPVWGWILPERVVRERARRLARRALVEHFPGETRSARTLRHWYGQGSYHWTFAVSRLDQS